jgi:hypothetical protein
LAVDEQFRAVISVDDRTAAPIRRIQQNLSRIGENTGLIGLGRVATRLSMSMGGLARATASVAAPLAVVGALGAGAGLVALVRATVDSAGALTDLSAQLGSSVESLQSLQFAAGQAGVGPEQLTGSLERLQRGMRDASVGGNKNLLALFRRMRIPLRDARGQLRGAAEVMPQLADAFAKTSNPAVRTAMAFALFGRAGGPLIAMLSQGGDALKEQQERWRELDGSITEANKGALDEVGDRLGEVGTALVGVRNAIVVRLAPALGPLLERMATWIAANKELIATKVEAWFLRVVGAIERFDLEAAITKVDGFLTKVNTTVEAMGGWERVIKLVGLALTASLVAPLVKIGATLAGIFAATPPAWLLALIRFAGAPAAIGGALFGLDRLGEQRDRTGTRQREQGKNFSGRGDLTQGFGPRPEDPGDEPAAAPAPPRVPRPALPGTPFNPLADPTTGRPLFRLQSFRPGGSDMGDDMPTRRPSIWDRPSATPQRGEVEVNVRFENTPPGARVEAETRGAAVRAPTLNVGYARMGVA